jgi:5'-3' exoribonuclease 1
MGVTRFYGAYIKKLPYDDLLQKKFPENLAGLLLDMNSILHNVASEVFGYSETLSDEASVKEHIRNTPYEELLVEFNVSVCKKLETFLNRYKPEDYIVFAVDGVAPFAKINQQRQRRFRGALSRKGDGFDTCSITPGTAFMNSFDAYFKKWLDVSKAKGILPPVSIYFNHLTTGEGEHKLYKYLRDSYDKFDATKSHLVYGADADLIMLALLNPVKNLFIHREDLDRVINIDALRVGLSIEFPDKPALLSDYVLLMYLIGNDFLPHLVTSFDIEFALEHILSTFKRFSLPLTSGDKILWYNFLLFLKELERDEAKMLIDTFVRTRGSSNRLKALSDEVVNVAAKSFNMPVFRKRYYEDTVKTLNHVKPRNTVHLDVAEAYLKGLQWTFLYYRRGSSYTIDWKYCYPYHFAPLICDMVECLTRKGIQETEVGFDDEVPEPFYDAIEASPNPINVNHQLLMVVPPTSHEKVLPKHLHAVASELYHAYPKTFVVDKQLTVAEYQGVCLLPNIDIQYLLHFYPELENAQLSEGSIVVETTKKRREKSHDKKPANTVVGIMKRYESTYEAEKVKKGLPIRKFEHKREDRRHEPRDKKRFDGKSDRHQEFQRDKKPRQDFQKQGEFRRDQQPRQDFQKQGEFQRDKQPRQDFQKQGEFQRDKQPRQDFHRPAYHKNPADRNQTVYRNKTWTRPGLDNPAPQHGASVQYRASPRAVDVSFRPSPRPEPRKPFDEDVIEP